MARQFQEILSPKERASLKSSKARDIIREQGIYVAPKQSRLTGKYLAKHRLELLRSGAMKFGRGAYKVGHEVYETEGEIENKIKRGKL